MQFHNIYNFKFRLTNPVATMLGKEITKFRKDMKRMMIRTEAAISHNRTTAAGVRVHSTIGDLVVVKIETALETLRKTKVDEMLPLVLRNLNRS